MYMSDNYSKNFLSFLLDTLNELVDLVEKKYGPNTTINIFNDKDFKNISIYSFFLFLFKYFSDPDVYNVITEKYKEFGKICGIFSFNYSQLGDFLFHLDEMSRLILMFISRKGYASLQDLSDVTGFTHYEILSRLQDIIIPKSMIWFGKPLVTFMNIRIDPISGEKISFSWWINDIYSNNNRQIELSENCDEIIITIELTGIDLPCTMKSSVIYNNGILEVKIKKRREIV